MEVDSTQVDMSDEQMDSVINQEAPSRDIPMEGPKEAPTAQEYTFKANGKEIKAPLDKILQWAQLGYGYPQKAQEFNKMKSEYDSYQKQRQEFEQSQEKWKPYREVDEFAQKNPDWWSQVQQAYSQKIQGATSSPEVAELKQQLQELKAFRDEIVNEKKSVKVQEEDKQLSQDVESIRKSYPNIDFDTPDEEGKNLEMKILDHAVNNGISSFRVAFRDFYHDHLLGKAREEGKEIVSKETKQKSKLGILGESPKPTKGLKAAENVRNKTYEQLMREALDEIRS